MSTRARSLLHQALVPVARRYLDEVFAGCPRRDFQLRFWNGSTWSSDHAAFTFVLNDPAVLRIMLDAPDELQLGEAYLRDQFDVEGDLEGAFEVADYLLASARPAPSRPFLVRAFGKPVTAGDGDHRGPAELRGAVHSKERDREAIRYHYDLPVDFYALGLDQRLVYSTASTRPVRIGMAPDPSGLRFISGTSERKRPVPKSSKSCKS